MGLKRLQEVTVDLEMLGLNRTSVGLKHVVELPPEIPEERLNRTSVGLKPTARG